VTRRLRLGVLSAAPSAQDVHRLRVTYQAAQFLAMREHADVLFGDEAFAAIDTLDAVLAFDERQLLMEIAPKLPDRLAPLLVFVTHDFWFRPLHVAQYLAGRPRVLSVVRHVAAQRLYRTLMPEVPCVVQRPGVDTSLFAPAAGPKEFDIMLSGNENDDYPVRQRLNAIVRGQAAARGWNVLDLSDPEAGGDGQREYAPSLALAKVSPTGTPRGAVTGGKLIMQYVDSSPVRLEFPDDPFYGYEHPEVVVRDFNPGGVPSPRYLESMACKTLLLGDLPDDEPWYRDKMVALSLDDSDTQLGDAIDYWVRADAERERLCEHAYVETVRTESTTLRGAELVEIIGEHL
jgi:hypothetical protein